MSVSQFWAKELPSCGHGLSDLTCYRIGAGRSCTLLQVQLFLFGGGFGLVSEVQVHDQAHCGGVEAPHRGEGVGTGRVDRGTAGNKERYSQDYQPFVAGNEERD